MILEIGCIGARLFDRTINFLIPRLQMWISTDFQPKLLDLSHVDRSMHRPVPFVRSVALCIFSLGCHTKEPRPLPPTMAFAVSTSVARPFPVAEEHEDKAAAKAKLAVMNEVLSGPEHESAPHRQPFVSTCNSITFAVYTEKTHSAQDARLFGKLTNRGNASVTLIKPTEKTHSAQDARLFGKLTNRGNASVTLIKPNDGSTAGLRNPNVTWKGSVVQENQSSCGNINPLQDADIVTIAPGESVAIAWIDMAKVQNARAIYRNDPDGPLIALGGGKSDPALVSRMRKTTPCEVVSNEISYIDEGAVAYAAMVKKGIRRPCLPGDPLCEPASAPPNETPVSPKTE
jgi:hypothetical protein